MLRIARETGVQQTNVDEAGSGIRVSGCNVVRHLLVGKPLAVNGRVEFIKDHRLR